MYTSMLDISARDKNMKVSDWKLTESCTIAYLPLICYGTNMLYAYLRHIIYMYRLQAIVCVFNHKLGEINS